MGSVMRAWALIIGQAGFQSELLEDGRHACIGLAIFVGTIEVFHQLGMIMLGRGMSAIGEAGAQEQHGSGLGRKRNKRRHGRCRQQRLD